MKMNGLNQSEGLIKSLMLLLGLLYFTETLLGQDNARAGGIHSIKEFIRNTTSPDSTRQGIIVAIPQTGQRTYSRINYETADGNGTKHVEVIWLTTYRQIFMTERIKLSSLTITHDDSIDASLFDVAASCGSSVSGDGQLVLLHLPVQSVVCDTFLIRPRIHNTVHVDTTYTDIITKPKWWRNLDNRKFWNLPFLGSFALFTGSGLWYLNEKSNTERYFSNIKTASNFHRYTQAVTSYERARTRRNIARATVITSGVLFVTSFIRDILRKDEVIYIHRRSDDSQTSNDRGDTGTRQTRLHRSPSLAVKPLVDINEFGLKFEF